MSEKSRKIDRTKMRAAEQKGETGRIERIRPILESPYGSVGFDGDGTLFHTYPIFFNAIIGACRHFGIKPPSFHRIRMNYDSSAEYADLLKLLAIPKELVASKDGERSPFLTKVSALCTALDLDNPATVIPGRMNILRELANAKLLLFFASGANREVVAERIKRNGLHEIFKPEHVFAGVINKSETIGRMRDAVSPKMTLYVGDIRGDHRDSESAGADCALMIDNHAFCHPHVMSRYVVAQNNSDHRRGMERPRLFGIKKFEDVVDVVRGVSRS